MEQLSALAAHMGRVGSWDPSRKVILGIAGEMGSGKTFLSDFLVKEYGAVKTSFADPLKKMLQSLGLTREQLWGSEKEIPDQRLLLGKTPRHAMQTLGTEWGRHCIHPDIWAAAWKTMLLEDQPTFTVIEDVRFDNEVDAIRSLGGKVIGIQRRARVQRRAFWRFGETKIHPSEDFWGMVERKGLRVVQNTSTIQELAGQVLEEVR